MNATGKEKFFYSNKNINDRKRIIIIIIIADFNRVFPTISNCSAFFSLYMESAIIIITVVKFLVH